MFFMWDKSLICCVYYRENQMPEFTAERYILNWYHTAEEVIKMDYKS